MSKESTHYWVQSDILLYCTFMLNAECMYNCSKSMLLTLQNKKDGCSVVDSYSIALTVGQVGVGS